LPSSYQGSFNLIYGKTRVIPVKLVNINRSISWSRKEAKKVQLKINPSNKGVFKKGEKTKKE